MKTYDFVQALNEIDDKYIEEAVHYKKPAGNLKLWRVVAIAACVCLAGTLAFTVLNLQNGRFDASKREAVSYEDGYQPAVYEDAAEEVAMFDNYEASLSQTSNAAIDYMEEAETWAETDAVAGGKTAFLQNAADAGSDDVSTDTPARIIYNVNLEMETTEFDQTNAQLDALVTEFSGYFDNQNISNYSGSYRNASYTIRIPAERLDDFIDQVGSISTVTRISRNAEDISEVYYDTSSRLDTAKAKLERLQELLGEAENMEDIISIESAISDAQWEIDNYSGSLNYYDSRVDYSTVTLYVAEVYEVVVDDAPQSFGEKIALAFTQGIRGVGEFLRDFVLWVAESWIWLIVFAAVVIAAIFIIRRCLRNRRSRRDREE